MDDAFEAADLTLGGGRASACCAVGSLPSIIGAGEGNAVLEDVYSVVRRRLLKHGGPLMGARAAMWPSKGSWCLRRARPHQQYSGDGVVNFEIRGSV